MALEYNQCKLIWYIFFLGVDEWLQASRPGYTDCVRLNHWISIIKDCSLSCKFLKHNGLTIRRLGGSCAWRIVTCCGKGCLCIERWDLWVHICQRLGSIIINDFNVGIVVSASQIIWAAGWSVCWYIVATMPSVDSMCSATRKVIARMRAQRRRLGHRDN